MNPPNIGMKKASSLILPIHQVTTVICTSQPQDVWSWILILNKWGCEWLQPHPRLFLLTPGLWLRSWPTLLIVFTWVWRQHLLDLDFFHPSNVDSFTTVWAGLTIVSSILIIFIFQRNWWSSLSKVMRNNVELQLPVYKLTLQTIIKPHSDNITDFLYNANHRTRGGGM